MTTGAYLQRPLSGSTMRGSGGTENRALGSLGPVLVVSLMVVGTGVQGELSANPAHSLHSEMMCHHLGRRCQWHGQMTQTSEQNLVHGGCKF